MATERSGFSLQFRICRIEAKFASFVARRLIRRRHQQKFHEFVRNYCRILAFAFRFDEPSRTFRRIFLAKLRPFLPITSFRNEWRNVFVLLLHASFPLLKRLARLRRNCSEAFGPDYRIGSVWAEKKKVI